VGTPDRRGELAAELGRRGRPRDRGLDPWGSTPCGLAAAATRTPLLRDWPPRRPPVGVTTYCPDTSVHRCGPPAEPSTNYADAARPGAPPAGGLDSPGGCPVRAVTLRGSSHRFEEPVRRNGEVSGASPRVVTVGCHVTVGPADPVELFGTVSVAAIGPRRPRGCCERNHPGAARCEPEGTRVGGGCQEGRRNDRSGRPRGVRFFSSRWAMRAVRPAFATSVLVLHYKHADGSRIYPYDPGVKC
jgi:hypothetical protein